MGVLQARRWFLWSSIIEGDQEIRSPAAHRRSPEPGKDGPLLSISRPYRSALARASNFLETWGFLTCADDLHLVALDWGEASWDGDSLIVELRYFPSIADAAIAAGLTFEREALPN